MRLAVAAFGLWHGRVPELVKGPFDVLRSAHSGIVGDYLLWIVGGTAAIGAIWAFTLP